MIRFCEGCLEPTEYTALRKVFPPPHGAKLAYGIGRVPLCRDCGASLAMRRRSGNRLFPFVDHWVAGSLVVLVLKPHEAHRPPTWTGAYQKPAEAKP